MPGFFETQGLYWEGLNPQDVTDLTSIEDDLLHLDAKFSADWPVISKLAPDLLAEWPRINRCMPILLRCFAKVIQKQKQLEGRA